MFLEKTMVSFNVGTLGYEKEWNDSYGLDKDPIRKNIVYPWINENLSDLNDKVILDAGCGNGSLGYFLKNQAFKSYIGIDISDIFLDYAKRNVVDDRITFKKANLLSRWDFPNNSFDIIFSIFVINELENLDFFFSETDRVLKNNGRAVIFLTHPFMYMYYLLKERFAGQTNNKFPELNSYFHSGKITYHFTLSEASVSVYPYSLSDVFTSISKANMFLKKVSELTTNSSELFYVPSYKETSDIPMFLALELSHLAS